jgi:hypothetical protein
MRVYFSLAKSSKKYLALIRLVYFYTKYKSFPDKLSDFRCKYYEVHLDMIVVLTDTLVRILYFAEREWGTI